MIYDHKTNHYIRHELQITGILDMIHEYRRNAYILLHYLIGDKVFKMQSSEE